MRACTGASSTTTRRSTPESWGGRGGRARVRVRRRAERAERGAEPAIRERRVTRGGVPDERDPWAGRPRRRREARPSGDEPERGADERDLAALVSGEGGEEATVELGEGDALVCARIVEEVHRGLARPAGERLPHVLAAILDRVDGREDLANTGLHLVGAVTLGEPAEDAADGWAHEVRGRRRARGAARIDHHFCRHVDRRAVSRPEP